jgi:hypothetical protein
MQPGLLRQRTPQRQKRPGRIVIVIVGAHSSNQTQDRTKKLQYFSPTWLTLTEDGSINPPLFRVAAKWFFGWDTNQRDYLAHLEK